jgi:ABC-2 type transport system ATP-binding protein
MDEAEKLCNRIAFIDKGYLVALDTLENLKQLIPAGDLIEIGLDTMDERVLPGIRSNQLVNSAEFRNNTLIISAKNGSRVLPAIINVFDDYSVPMNSIAIHSPSLEDVFIYLTGSKLDAGNNEGANPGARGRPA